MISTSANWAWPSVRPGQSVATYPGSINVTKILKWFVLSIYSNCNIFPLYHFNYEERDEMPQLTRSVVPVGLNRPAFREEKPLMVDFVYNKGRLNLKFKL